MPQENYQKIKLLKLLELLKQETDEQNPLTTNEICARLADMNISCDRRTLSKDIKTLNSFGFEVLSRMKSHDKAYYIIERSFTVPELKILIDAIQAAGFITEKKTKDLIDKVASLGGTHRAELIKSNLICFNTRKHSNESVYYTVDSLEKALLKKKQVSFYYFDLNEKGEKIYRKNKKLYVVEPMALIYYEDNYYLMCYSPKYNDTVNYRVDRMSYVEVLEESVSENAVLKNSDISEYTEQVFKMYGGEKTDITLQFDDSLIGVIYDKFGEDTLMIRLNENTCVARVSVQVSPTFWGWLFQFGERMKITSPETLIDEYKEKCKIIAEG